MLPRPWPHVRAGRRLSFHRFRWVRNRTITSEGKASFLGSYPVRASTPRSVFMDLASELGEQGFRWILVAHVHGAGLHNRVLDQASDYFHDTYGGCMAHVWNGAGDRRLGQGNVATASGDQENCQR